MYFPSKRNENKTQAKMVHSLLLNYKISYFFNFSFNWVVFLHLTKHTYIPKYIQKSWINSVSALFIYCVLNDLTAVYRKRKQMFSLVYLFRNK